MIFTVRPSRHNDNNCSLPVVSSGTYHFVVLGSILKNNNIMRMCLLLDGVYAHEHVQNRRHFPSA